MKYKLHDKTQPTQSKLSRWQRLKRIIFSPAFVIVFLLCAIVYFRLFIVGLYKIPSGAMEDTLLAGDHILICKCMYGFKIPGTDIKVFDFHKPAREDVIVFIPPHNDRNFIKRIVAVEGDTVYTEGKTLYVNGKAIDDSGYTKHMEGAFFRRGDFPPFRQMQEYMRGNELYDDYTMTNSQFKRRFPDGKPFTVPKGHVFAMGDNRDQSSDSRTWGPVPVENIKGQAFIIYWSINNNGNNRSNRIGKRIR
ncbi:MAG: signal peptidase I [Candidatus Poribacteria bacterium]|nr:signal peptidase I [Candidatus Poribacteria bacterium]